MTPRTMWIALILSCMSASVAHARKKPVRTDLIRWSLFSPKTALMDELRTQPQLNDLSLTPKFFTSKIEERTIDGSPIKKYQSQASLGVEVSWNHHWDARFGSELFALSSWTHWGKSQEGRLENQSTVVFGFGMQTHYRPWKYTRLSLILSDQQEILLRNTASGPLLEKSLVPSLGLGFEQIFFGSGAVEILANGKARRLLPDGSGLGADLQARFLEQQWSIAVGFFYERTDLTTEDRNYLREDGGLKLSLIWNLEAPSPK